MKPYRPADAKLYSNGVIPMKKILAGLLFLILCASRPLDAREKTYTEQLRRDVVRSTTNLVSAPAEVLTTVQKYHREPGPRVFREMAGFVDGVFRVITRFGSGAWDAFAAFIPGMQDGLPPDPEALS